MPTRRLLFIGLAALIVAGCGEQTTESRQGDAGLFGQVHLGPQCPVETEADPCADAPASSSQVTISLQIPGDSYTAGEVVARTTTRADGSYRVAVAPGNYVATADAGMSCELMDARVDAGAYSRVEIPCDTGIR